MQKHVFYRAVTILCGMLFFLYSCNDNKEYDDEYYFIETSGKLFTVDHNQNILDLVFESNTEEAIETIITYTTGTDWCDVKIVNNAITVTVKPNQNNEERKAVVQLKNETAKTSLRITQAGRVFPVGEMVPDVKLKVTTATASSVRASENEKIENSYDGILDAKHYHSAYESTVTFPVELIYYIENDGKDLDFIKYYPRPGNGNFKEFSLWISTSDAPSSFAKVGDYNFDGVSTASIVNLPSPVKNVAAVKFLVGPGTANVVSCSEMEFYNKGRSAEDFFDYTSIFTDKTCSELKSGIALSEIEAIDIPLYKKLALELYNKSYNKEFRVQEYKAYQHPHIIANQNKTERYGQRDNVTGIYVNEGDTLVAMVGDMHGQNISIVVQNLLANYNNSTSYALNEGLNRIVPQNRGLIYVIYLTDKGIEKPIKINFVTGNVNGYFDSEKHTTQDWTRLINSATYNEFDLKGKLSVSTFPTKDFKKYTPDGVALANKIDDIVFLQQEFMGLVKYNKMYKNRLYLHVDYDISNMFATAFHTAYGSNHMPDICNVNSLHKNPWGVAHEIGHVNQTRSEFRWAGMTEVSNNVHSLYIQTSFGNRTRLLNENVYQKALANIVDKGICYNVVFEDGGVIPPGMGSYDRHFLRLVPFWQLKLYLVDALGKADFYKDLYEDFRVDPLPTTATAAEYQMNFVKKTCDKAQLDMTQFFETWGFFKPVNVTLDDYGSKRFEITQALVNETKAYITSKNYPKPKHTNIHLINDDNVSNYKN